MYKDMSLTAGQTDALLPSNISANLGRPANIAANLGRSPGSGHGGAKRPVTRTSQALTWRTRADAGGLALAELFALARYTASPCAHLHEPEHVPYRGAERCPLTTAEVRKTFVS